MGPIASVVGPPELDGRSINGKQEQVSVLIVVRAAKNHFGNAIAVVVAGVDQLHAYADISFAISMKKNPSRFPGAVPAASAILE